MPDIFIDRVIVLGQLKTSDGDSFRVTQRFIGDGYLTLFDHTNQSGQSWHSGFDGDAYKAWSATLEKTNDTVIIRVLHQSFFYNLNAHTMTEAKGRRHGVTEKAVALTNTTDLFRVVIDAGSGKYAAVNKDRRVLAVKDKSGNLVWTNDLIATFGSNLPMFSDEKIESLESDGVEIDVNVGNRFICIDPQNGKITRTGIRSSR